MPEIAAVPANGLRVVSTFSGCGGSCLGFEMAGYRVLWANEFIPAARETYRANHAGVFLDERDIRSVKPEEILEQAGLKVGELDVFEGSPPCASFSTAGKREAGWKKVKKYSDTEQRTDDLFFEYVRLLRGLRPKVFVAENVSGLFKGTAIGYFKIIFKELATSGYEVVARVLDSRWLGVPQARRRIIFVGAREDLRLEPRHPKPLGYSYSIRDAIPWISRGADATGMIYEANPEASMEGLATGAEWDVIGGTGQSEKYFQLVRPNVDAPCPTITQLGGNAGLASVAHPTEKRKFYIGELKRLCGFPDDFVLTGTYMQQWERLGRSVPPPMMRAVAETIRNEMLK
jgi:DNA (cytosine-5)-methyltransferase 1